MALIHRTVKGALAESLRDEIISGNIPPGQPLRLEDLAAQFDVSTMPVREALRELEAEGLVKIFPHRGAVVTELTADELEDIYDIRATLEAMGARLAVPRLTEETLGRLHTLVDQMDSHLGEVAALVKLNNEFHLALYAASGRDHLCDLIKTLRLRTQHYLHAFISDLGGMPQAQSEHRAIVEFCKRGDGQGAARIMHEHVARVGRALIEYVQQREGPAPF